MKQKKRTNRMCKICRSWMYYIKEKDKFVCIFNCHETQYAKIRRVACTKEK